MADLSVNIGSLMMSNPVMTASGTFGYGKEFEDFVDLEKIGGIIVKGTTLHHREGNPYPRMAETPMGMLNAVGLQNKGVNYFVEHIYPQIKDINTNMIVNVSGSAVEDYAKTAEIINELDKAASGKGNGNPADVLLTLLDNLGFTDNYMECMIPTGGVYPIATANVKEDISAPLMSRFAVIDIPDYTQEEKKIIFSKFALPKVLKRIGLLQGEIVLTGEGLDELIEQYKNTSGIRDLEQAAEHLAANALYQIEVDHVKQVVFDAEMVKKLFA